MKPRNGIPDRWLAYRNLGEPISGTRFVAFKAPLGENYFFKLRTNDRFSPGQLFEALPELGLVIDLTNTDRYYQPELFEQHGIRHQKIACPGRAIPAERLVRRFCSVVQEFLRQTATNGSLVGVHCTHGINRSGYMICSYMIREMLMNPRDAIAAFEVARGYPIERKEYIDALLNLRLDGAISDRQRMMDTAYLDESGPSTSAGTIGQGHRHCIQWNTHPELPDGVVRMRPNSHLTVGSSTSTTSPWCYVSGPEVNVRPTTSGSSDSTWPPMTGTVAGSSERNPNFNIHGYSTIPRLHTAGMYARTHLPHTCSRPDPDLNIEPEHSSTAEYGSSQRERTIADGFSEHGRSQHIRYGGDLERREAPKRHSAAPSRPSQHIEDTQPILGAVTSEPSQFAIDFVSTTTSTLPPRLPSPVITPHPSPDFNFGNYQTTPSSLEIGSLFRMSQCTESCFGSYSMYQEASNVSPFSWHRFYSDYTLPKPRKFDRFDFKAIPRYILAPNQTDDSSDDITSSSSWDSWPRSRRGVYDLSNDIDLDPQYNIGCIPRPQFNTGVDFGSRYNPFSETGFSSVLSDVDVDSTGERIPRDGGIIISVNSTTVSSSSPSPSPFILTHGLRASPQVPSRVSAPLQVLEDLPALVGPRNESYVDHDLTPRFEDRALDWESVLASLHRRTSGNAGRASRHAMSNSATSTLEGRDYRNELPLRLRVDVRTSEANPNVDWGAVLATFPHQTYESSNRVSQYSMPSVATPTLESREDNYEQPTESESNSAISHTAFPSGVSSLSTIMYNHKYPTGVSDHTVQSDVTYDCTCSAPLPLGSGLSSVLSVMDLHGVVERPLNEGGIFFDLSDGQHSNVTSSPVPASPSPYTPPPPLEPLPSPIEPFPLVTPALPSTLPVAPEALQDLPMPSEPTNESSDIDRETESRFRDTDLDWEAILASLHRHTRMSAGRASRHAMRTSPSPGLDGREDHHIQMQQRPPSFPYSEDPQTAQDGSQRRGNERRRRRRNRRRHRRGANNGRGIGIDVNRPHEESNGQRVLENVIARVPVRTEGAMRSLEGLGASGRRLVSSSMVE